MCTLSFLPETDGYIVGMNRDEMKSRCLASAPKVQQLASVYAVYPQEQNGGTWIAANSRGNLFALLNLNGIAAGKLPLKLRSRGDIIPAVLQEATPESVERAVLDFGLVGFHPFRLICVFPGQRELRQWRWDGEQFSSRWMEWTRTHWFSSSRSDLHAEERRGQACESTWREGLSDRVGWLRDLHASHLPEAGPYSICVHRPDAATVSYTEVQCGQEELQMTYVSGHPCSPKATASAVKIELESVYG